MKIRYQADNDLRGAIVRGTVRREPNIDFRSAQAAKLDSMPDLAVLSIAQRDARILVSHDLQTMPTAFREFVKGHVSPGVFLVPQDCSIGRVVEHCFLCGKPLRFRTGRTGYACFPVSSPSKWLNVPRWTIDPARPLHYPYDRRNSPIPHATLA